MWEGMGSTWKGCIGFLQRSLNKDTMRWRGAGEETLAIWGERNSISERRKMNLLGKWGRIVWLCCQLVWNCGHKVKVSSISMVSNFLLQHSFVWAQALSKRIVGVSQLWWTFIIFIDCSEPEPLSYVLEFHLFYLWNPSPHLYSLGEWHNPPPTIEAETVRYLLSQYPLQLELSTWLRCRQSNALSGAKKYTVEHHH